jgi:hypothetical protein
MEEERRTLYSEGSPVAFRNQLIASASEGQNLCEFSVPLSFKIWDTRGSYIGNGKRQILQVRDAIGRQRRSDRCVVVVLLEVIIILFLDFKIMNGMIQDIRVSHRKKESSRSSHAP